MNDEKQFFTDEQLIYAATARCDCGAGFAYPSNPTVKQCRAWMPDSPFRMWDHWVCSDILTGRAVRKCEEGAKTHSGALPFVFWEVKSEMQPSAQGRTTRPGKEAKA